MNTLLRGTGPKLGALFVVGVVWALLAWTSPAGADPGTSVSIAPASQTVDPGDDFDVQVVINTDVASRGAQIGLNFNPAIVEWVGTSSGNPDNGWTEGSFYSAWFPTVCDTLVYPEPTESPAGHLTDMAVAIMPEPGDTCAGGPTGSGTVVTFHFRAKMANGVSSMNLVNVVVSDAQNPPHQIQGVVVNNGWATVGTGGTASVGGVAELPEVAQSSGDEAAVPADAPNSPMPIYAVVAGSVAAALVLLGVVGWQAKRRRVL